jgi:predicted PurR-regulated permease PerM
MLRAGNAGLSVLGIGAAIALLYYGQAFFITLITALITAFMLELPVHALTRLRLPRNLASFLVCVVGLLIVYLAGMAIYAQSSIIVEDLPRYSDRIGQIGDDIAQRVENMEAATYRLLVPKRLQEEEKQRSEAEARQAEARKARRARTAEPPPPAVPPPVQEVRIQPERPPLITYLYSNLGSLYHVLLMASFVPFLVYFMLSWRDHIYRSFLQLFHDEARLVAGKSAEGIASMVRAYVVGNFVLGTFLAVFSCLVFWTLRLPYPFLSGVLSGYLTLVPYVGLPLALLPPLVAAITAYTKMAGYFLIAASVASLHLIGANVLYPKFVGGRVHLNPLVVTVSLMFWGTLWGAVGLVLAIPITAGIKAVCDNVGGLRAYGKLLGD